MVAVFFNKILSLSFHLNNKNIIIIIDSVIKIIEIHHDKQYKKRWFTIIIFEYFPNIIEEHSIRRVFILENIQI